jgi:hypothetical protein
MAPGDRAAATSSTDAVAMSIDGGLAGAGSGSSTTTGATSGTVMT